MNIRLIKRNLNIQEKLQLIKFIKKRHMLIILTNISIINKHKLIDILQNYNISTDDLRGRNNDEPFVIYIKNKVAIYCNHANNKISWASTNPYKPNKYAESDIVSWIIRNVNSSENNQAFRNGNTVKYKVSEFLQTLEIK